MAKFYMTLGFYAGFDALFKPTYEVLTYTRDPIFNDTKLIRQMIKDKVLEAENDYAGLSRFFIERQLLHPTGQLIEGVVLDRALREKTHIELPPRDDEKRFSLAWTTVNTKLPVTPAQTLKKTVKLPIGVFEQGTPLPVILEGLKPAFPQFDIDQALEEGVNLMLLKRREAQLDQGG